MSGGKKIIDGLNEAIAFAMGDDANATVWHPIPAKLTDDRLKELGTALNDRFPGLHPGNCRSYAKAVHAALVKMDFRK